jgi:hypothetical protein
MVLWLLNGLVEQDPWGCRMVIGRVDLAEECEALTENQETNGICVRLFPSRK